jgi:hypothetical protein
MRTLKEYNLLRLLLFAIVLGAVIGVIVSVVLRGFGLGDNAWILGGFVGVAVALIAQLLLSFLKRKRLDTFLLRR